MLMKRERGREDGWTDKVRLYKHGLAHLQAASMGLQDATMESAAAVGVSATVETDEFGHVTHVNTQ